MKSLLLIIIPVAGSLIAALWPSNRSRPWLLPAVGFLHLVLTFWLLFNPPVIAANCWMGFDPLARAVLLFEGIWPALWPPAGVLGAFACAALPAVTA